MLHCDIFLYPQFTIHPLATLTSPQGGASRVSAPTLSRLHHEIAIVGMADCMAWIPETGFLKQAIIILLVGLVVDINTITMEFLATEE